MPVQVSGKTAAFGLTDAQPQRQRSTGLFASRRNDWPVAFWDSLKLRHGARPGGDMGHGFARRHRCPVQVLSG